MERSAYQSLSQAERVHWWHRGRREILGAVLDRFAGDKPDWRILEIGAGTGGNVEMLRRYGDLATVELDEGAREILTARYPEVATRGGALPDPALFDQKSYDLVAMFDVIEHVEEERAALQITRAHVPEGGLLFVTVPAYEWLWSKFDDFAHHKRRYTRPRLRKALEGAGWQVLQVGYFNSFLFPIAVLVRLAQKLTGGDGSAGLAVPGDLVNAAFFRIFVSERGMVVRGGFPFGLSVLAIARNPSAVSRAQGQSTQLEMQA